MDKNNVIKEYEELRVEIREKIELHNTLITFMITSVIAVLAFAVQKNITKLYLLPFGVIIPITMRVTYYRTAMAKLSAYIEVYLEPCIEELNWETRNRELMNKQREKKAQKSGRKKKNYDGLTISHYYEGFVMSVVSYVLYVFHYLGDKELCFATVAGIVLPFLLVIWEFGITRRIVKFDDEKDKWYEAWKEMKDTKN